MNKREPLKTLLLNAHQSFMTRNEAKGRAQLRMAMSTALRDKLTQLHGLPREIGASLSRKAGELDLLAEMQRQHAEKGGYAGDDAFEKPFRVMTMGHFAVYHHGECVADDAEQHSRPAHLLKVLIAYGARSVNIECLSDNLWPDDEGDVAAQNFKITLYRLRKLMGKDALLLKDGKLSLVYDYCTLDVHELEKRFAMIEAMQNRELPDGATLERLTRELLGLYKGHFMAQEDVEAWPLSMREKLRSRFLRSLLFLGEALEKRSFFDEAIMVYRCAIDTDDLAEEFYQRLVALLIRRGRRLEAVSVYRRCQMLMHAILGIEPGRELTGLVQNLAAPNDQGLRIMRNGH